MLAPGEIDVPVASGTRSAIITALDGTTPWGGTPTPSTLGFFADSPEVAGLDATDRANAILLITDGNATGYKIFPHVCSSPCSDNTKNGNETDKDCGGSCAPCVDGKACNGFDDCESALCVANVCLPATCADSSKNVDETDVDCGGSCSACDNGMACSSPTDCRSGKCTSDICEAEACDDSLQNGDESDLDCGGSCTACVIGKKCLVDSDCDDATSDTCQAGECRPASC